MTLPVLLTSDMAGSPALTFANGTINGLLNACLVNGFNTQSVVSATAIGGVVTFNFASSHGFEGLHTVTIAGASNSAVNGQRRVLSAASNQVLVAIPGVPDGAVAGTITMKFSPLGWTRPYSATNLGVYRQGGSATHKRNLRIYDGAVTTATEFNARGYEAMTAVSTGTGPFPTTTQSAGNGVSFYAVVEQYGFPNTPRPWVIVGTPRFFAMYIGYAGTDSATQKTVSEFTLSMSQAFLFGELASLVKPADAYATVIPTSATGNRLYASRAVTGAGTALQLAAQALGTNNQFNTSGGAMYPSPSDGGLHLYPAPLIYDEVSPSYPARGLLPGCLQPFESPGFNNSGLPMNVGNILSGISGVTGRIMFGCHAFNNWSDLFWLLDEDWGDV